MIRPAAPQSRRRPPAGALWPRGTLRPRVARWRARLLLLLLSLLQPLGARGGVLPVRAAPGDVESPPPSFSARPLFSGWVDGDRWTMVTADLGQPTGPARLLTLRATQALMRGGTATAVEVVGGSRKRVDLLLKVDAHPGEVALTVSAPEGQLLEQALMLTDTAGRSLAVVVAEGEADLRGVEALGGGQPAVVALERPADLPEEALAYASVDHLVLAGLGWEDLRAAQREAIRQWVGLGGHLVFTGGPAAARTVGRAPAGMRSASVLSTRGVADLEALAALGGDGAPRGPATLAELVPEGGAEVLLGLADGSPLAVQGRYGDGRVTTLALDPFQAPLRGWSGLAAFWRALARDFPLPDTAWSSPPPDLDALGQLLRAAQGLPLPSLGWIMALLLFYAVLVGPVNHRLLRRYRRLDLAWLTIPALSLLVAALGYGVGRRLHGNDLRLDELSLVRAVPEAGVAHVLAILSLSSPGSRTYELTAERGAFWPVDLQTGAAPQVWQERHGRLSGLAVEQWSQRQVMAEAVIPWPRAAGGHLTLANGQARADLPNPLGLPLADVQLLVPGDHQWLGSVAQEGQLGAVLNYEAFSGASLLNPASPGQGDAARRWTLLQAFREAAGADMSAMSWMTGHGDPAALVLPSFRRPDAWLLGWTARPMLAVTATGHVATRGDLALIHTRLPIDLGGETPRFLNGMATSRGAGSAGRCGSGAALLSAAEPRADFSFPLGLGRPQSGRVWLSLVGPANAGEAAPGFPFGADAFPVRIALWDQAQESWLTFNVLGVGQSAEIPRLISRADGRDQIRLRLEADLSGSEKQERWRMFDGCVEPRVAIQEGVAAQVSAEGLPSATPAPDGAASAAPPPLVPTVPADSGGRP